ncbi:tetratricopeptide repeat protein 33-like [Limulus polyphemus]|uniref:Tetratricopeptide repeat protein 33-like n=1 Tax=Limulus polyphemus TaxID=6850 RepID=A0ABM1TNQ6_LIMPO|nr:tetratricopeptide repeat protein 33-like [Limulus polyphemus]XP_022257511.1 tetratricopeptide repeat protein 33-like [Limulus polyphemus]XP_022257512.1 tetratricopeptide repeat protein 33-like [Limulus polyphemus]
MTSFGWKRKVGQKISKEVSQVFTEASLNKDEGCYIPDDVDWLDSFKRRKAHLLEDCKSKSQRLKNEGTVLAENGRYWEAIKKWDEAIQLTPVDEGICQLYEMKSQALMQLNEVFPAVQAAEKAVNLNPVWWIAYQTLGRAQLGIGEIKLALTSFSKAYHINPANVDLWENDIKYTHNLVKKKKQVESAQSYEEYLCKQALAESENMVFDEDGVLISFREDSTKTFSKNVKNDLVRCRF